MTQRAATTAVGQIPAVVLRPVRAHHAFEACVEQLATAIRLGAWARGELLPPERELAARLQVSRATLREAIAALRAAGMVRTRRGRGGGTEVTSSPTVPNDDPDQAGAILGAGPLPGQPPRTEQLLDTLVYRRIVEPGACEYAASLTLAPAQRELLAASLAEVEGAGDPAEHRQADARLHLALAGVTGSAAITSAVTHVQADLHTMLCAIPSLPVNIDHSTDQHRSIVRAVLAGNPARARRAMERHCDDTAALLRGFLG